MSQPDGGLTMHPCWFGPIKGSNEIEYRWKDGTWFILRPKNRAHASAMGLPYEYRYAAFEAGADPSGCAARRGVFYTLEEAQLACERQISQRILDAKGKAAGKGSRE